MLRSKVFFINITFLGSSVMAQLLDSTDVSLEKAQGTTSSKMREVEIINDHNTISDMTYEL